MSPKTERRRRIMKINSMSELNIMNQLERYYLALLVLSDKIDGLGDLDLWEIVFDVQGEWDPESLERGDEPTPEMLVEGLVRLCEKYWEEESKEGGK